MFLEDIEVGGHYAMAESNFKQRFCHVKVLAVGVPRDKAGTKPGRYAHKVYYNSVLIEMVDRYDVRLKWPTGMVVRRDLLGRWLGTRRYLVDSRLIVEPWDSNYHPRTIARARAEREVPMIRYKRARDELYEFVRRYLSDEFPSTKIDGSQLNSMWKMRLWDAVKLAEMIRLLEELSPDYRERLERRAVARRSELIAAVADVYDFDFQKGPWKDAALKHREGE